MTKTSVKKLKDTGALQGLPLYKQPRGSFNELGEFLNELGELLNRLDELLNELGEFLNE